MVDIDFNKIEKKWQERWEKKKAFVSKEDKKKKKYYVLEQFPYPSGTGLHIGHAFVYTIGDIHARFKRMNGFNVLYPMGYDSLGLPAENAAIKEGIHPKDYTDRSIKNFIRQQKALGLSYDWTRLFWTHDPNYYKWDQWIFLKMFEKGLVYQKKSPVNYCPKCDTVLANEQVHNGFCWRHEDTKVEIKHLNQWYFRITDYAEELADFEKVKEWPDLIKKLQKNWIGKSHGTEIDFEIPTNLNFVQLHGFTADPNEDFHPWLKKELEKRGYKVSIPKLPNTDNPDINEQVDYVLKNCRFDENTVLIGHSLGSVVALKVLEKLNKPIKKLILAAGFIEPDFLDKKRPFEKKFDWKFDFNKIKNNTREVLILRAKNDSAVPKDRADKIQKAIGGKIIDFTAEDDHICGKEEPVVLNNCLEKWPIFTTRPDTIYGVTFMVVSAQHPNLMELVTKENKEKVEKFVKKLSSVSQEDIDQLDKEGVFTGSYAVNPVNNEKIPVYAGNFVLADYGCGMVMAVPAHDQRDFEFAKKYNIKIKVVINPQDYDLNAERMSRAYVGDGKLVNSGEFDGWNNREAIDSITEFLQKKKLGRKVINYKLRDWLISRQRYWGTPIPVIHCDKCGVVPVNEKDLPVELPYKVKFGKGNPLESAESWKNVKCPRCKGKARRETDTMDTFVNSSWYYLRYCDSKNNKKIFDSNKAGYWIPIDMYIGGKEHACMHDIYIRFYTKFLRDIGLIKINEPAVRLFVQGMVHGEDGNKMSKSLGNVVDPLDTIKKYSADSLRMFLVSVASPESDFNWSDSGIESMHKFIRKYSEILDNIKIKKSSKRLESKLNKAIKEVSEDIESFRYNLAVIKLRMLLDLIIEEGEISRNDMMSYVKLIGVFAPHVSEEHWEKLGNKWVASSSDKSDEKSKIANKSLKGFLSLSSWPVCDEKKIDMNLEKQEEMNENLVKDIVNILRIVKEKQGKEVKKIYVYTIPNELSSYNSENIKKRVGMQVEIFSAGDKNKHDPSGISKKAKPGKPGIFVE